MAGSDVHLMQLSRAAPVSQTTMEDEDGSDGGKRHASLCLNRAE